MPIQFNGETYPTVTQDKMTPGEIDAVERVTGLTFQKIRRLGELCVCEHGVKDHMHLDDAGEVSEDHSCTREGCSCEAHEPDLPSRVSIAFVWVSIKRQSPTVQYSQVADTPFVELFVDDEVDQVVDPSESPQPEASLL